MPSAEKDLSIGLIGDRIRGCGGLYLTLRYQTISGSLAMAKLLINDLKADVELDREAMAAIMGGRGPAYRQGTGISPAACTGAKPSFTGAFCGNRRNRYTR